MKKFWSLLPLVIALTFSVAAAEAAFPDLPENHWAYSAVEKMRNDGRVNGFPDGEFKPDELVTRWQFAKMAGGDPDVMTEPDRPATRDEAIEYLWNRAGKPAEIAPSVITDGSKTPEAVAWGYTRGVMQGDDGLNLRLDSTLTRAEASTLIVRAEDELPYVNFKDTVSSLIVERVWNGLQTGIAYEPVRTISGGELARIALQIGYERKNLNYMTMRNLPDFEGEYAKDVQLVAEECLGLEKANAEFMNNPVSMQDAVALLSFYSMRQATGSLKFSGDAKYADVDLTANNAKMALQFARYNGVLLFSNDSINAQAQATVKDLSCVLLQLDEIVGLTETAGNKHKTRFLKQEYPWPSNAADYDYILDEVPVSVYETPLLTDGAPAGNSEIARSFEAVFMGFLESISAKFPKGVKSEWTYYPSLVAQGKDDIVIRVKLTIMENPEGLTLNQLLTQNQFPETYSNSEYFIDISVGTSSFDVLFDDSKYTALRVF